MAAGGGGTVVGYSDDGRGRLVGWRWNAQGEAQRVADGLPVAVSNNGFMAGYGVLDQVQRWRPDGHREALAVGTGATGSGLLCPLLWTPRGQAMDPFDASMETGALSNGAEASFVSDLDNRGELRVSEGGAANFFGDVGGTGRRYLDGVLVVSAAPEPSRVALCLGGLVLLARRRHMQRGSQKQLLHVAEEVEAARRRGDA